MNRATIEAKLERIIRTVEASETPTSVHKIWVFGSYRRGAINCGDLDLVLLADRPSEAWFAQRKLTDPF